jgi:hypothetical protein
LSSGFQEINDVNPAGVPHHITQRGVVARPSKIAILNSPRCESFH